MIIRKAILLFCALLLLVLAAHPGQAQTCANGEVPTWSSTLKWTCASPTSAPLPAGSSINMTIANAGTTGTTANRLAKLTGAPSTAVITATSDVDNALGVCIANCGTTGSATVAIIGQVTCDFDNATTAGNYVTISAITAGKCHDAGSSYPTAGATYGRVLSTNGGSGSYVMELMTPDIAFQNAGNGKSRPGGSNTQIQYNDSNVFGGSSQFTWNKTTQKLTIGGSGAANGILSVQDNVGRALDFTWGGFSQSISANGAELDIAAGDIYIYTNGSSQRWRFASTGDLIPSGSNGGFSIADAGHNVNSLYMYKQIVFTNVNDATASEPFLSHARTWNNAGVTFENIKSNISVSAAGVNSSLIDLQVASASKFKIRKDGLLYIGASTVYSPGTPGIAGNGTLDTGSRDSAGKVSVTTTGAATVTLTFANTFTNAPACNVTNETTANLARATSTTTTVVLAGTTVTGDKYAYTCIGY